MNDIVNLYECAVKILTPKSYQWKAVAEQMYKIAKEKQEGE